MAIRIHFAPGFPPKGLLWAETSSYEESKWLAEAGWFYFGEGSAPDLSRKLIAAGVPLKTRWLAVSTKGDVAAQIYGKEGVIWDPDAAAIVSGSAAAQQASWAQDADVPIPTPRGLEYRPYQRAGVAFALAAFARGQKGVIFGAEMGLGKTMMAIGVIALTKPNKVLIACPASLKANWKREIEKWIPAFKGDIAVIEDEAKVPDEAIVILNYDKVVGARVRAKSLRASLLEQQWDLFIADEAHVLKNPSAQRTKIFLGEWKRGALIEPGVAQNADKVLLLTGTPIQNKVRESITLLHAIGALGEGGFSDEWKFLKRYCGMVKGAYGTTFDGATNLNELQSKLRAGWMHRVLKAEVATELPPKLRSVITLPYDGDDFDIDEDWWRAGHGRQYVGEEEEVRDPLAGFEGAVKRLLSSKRIRFEDISGYRAELAEQKQDAVIAHVRELLEEDDERKVIVFAHHKTLIDALEVAFPDSIRIDGGTPPGQRQGLVDRFQTDPAIRVAILSTHAAGVGLTLTAANIVVFAEADWNPSWCVQAEDRAHRIGQEADTVTVQYLVLDNTLDARVLQTMVDKMDIAERALDRRPVSRPVPTPPPPALKRAAAPAGGTPITITPRGQQPATYTITPEKKTWIYQALIRLQEACDGARTRDNCGFNGNDAQSSFVQSLVQGAYAERLSDKQAAWALQILRTYSKTQLRDLYEKLYDKKPNPYYEAVYDQ